VTIAEEDPPAAIEESASLLQAETVAQVAEATPLEATVVEGMYTLTTPFASGSSRSPRVLTSCTLY
jgi:hypothetical protein